MDFLRACVVTSNDPELSLYALRTPVNFDVFSEPDEVQKRADVAGLWISVFMAIDIGAPCTRDIAEAYAKALEQPLVVLFKRVRFKAAA